jgi:DNA (cytosine-5)-methyltransferase 1
MAYVHAPMRSSRKGSDGRASCQPATPPIAAVDLFCGVGGKTHGFIKAGIPVVAGVDIDHTCKFAFEANNTGATFYCKSVDELTPEEIGAWYPANAFRVLIGCAPCQPFSTYSYRYRTAKGKPQKDVRWGLLSTFSGLVRELQPDIVTAENVPELSLQKHQVYLRFISDLKSIGYHVTSKVVRCADYGVPQTRKRLVVLASKFGSIDLVEPTHSPDRYVTVRDRIGDLPPITAGGPPPANDLLHRSCGLSPRNLRRIRATPYGGGWQDWPASLRLRCHKKATGKTYPSVYGRMSWDDLAPTITTQCFGLGNGRFGHPVQDRAISLREAALLQTFPPDYAFVEPEAQIMFARIGRHIGNAVPVELGRAIARSIILHLQEVVSPTPKIHAVG